ncbi:MAG: biosynthetic-type acetolactate synthase large subunit, partial [Gemmatimonadota bacterium]|nr:biosynthetic-type acetolactate synthase large subunit [Gemmatimonadota bacterium]
MNPPSTTVGLRAGIVCPPAVDLGSADPTTACGDEKKVPMTTAADAFWCTLEEEGVEVVFGHPGGAILPVYDALHRSGRIHHVLTRHEQGAAHAADGYARATGRVGVCLTTSGPGATNLVTGLATAFMDSVPLVAVTGQVSRAVMGTQAFQETDIVGVTLPVTKHSFVIESADQLVATVREAFRIAQAGRPGPVLVDFPKCVQQDPCPVFVPARPQPTRVAHTPSANGCPSWTADLRRAATLLMRARRPVIMAGRGVILSDTASALRDLAETCDLPVVTTLLGLDAFPATDPRALGMPGMHGTERANRAIQESDLVLGLGLRFDDRVIGAPGTFAPRAHIVHFDISPAVIGRTVDVDVSVVGDLRETLPALAATAPRAVRPEWWEVVRMWCREVPIEPEETHPSSPLTQRWALRALAERITRSGSVVVTDVGQHQMWMAQELRDADARTHLTSGGLGAMGYALPAGIGAALGARERPVWVVTGDGGFQMALHELATVVQERLPLRIAVLNNGFLGMVRQWQELFYEGRYSASALSGPDLVLLAQAYGIAARAVDCPGALEAALDWAEAEAGPTLLDLRVQEEENVYPMVP